MSEADVVQTILILVVAVVLGLHMIATSDR